MTPNADLLAQPLSAMRGVGPERSSQLARLELQTVGDLMLHRPRRYDDRRYVQKIADLSLGVAATVCGHVVALGTKRFAHGRKSVFELVLDDGTARLHCRWWNLPYMKNYFETGQQVLVFGKPIALKPRTIDHPEAEVIEPGVETSIHLNRIAPIYPLTEGLPQRWLRSLAWRVLHDFGSCIPEPWPSPLGPDYLSRREAIRLLHFPDDPQDMQKARARLALDELVEFQVSLQRRRRALLTIAQSRPCSGNNRLIRPFLAKLGFKLTEGQIAVLQELRLDMGQRTPMRRLLQGEVGSGKTVVAACCALLALESGFNVVLMAPTEILAEQHFRNFARWFESLGIRVQLRTGGHNPAGNKAQPELGLKTTDSAAAPSQGAGDVLTIGTHALLEDSFVLENLGLVIIDEQHRFGVAQREKLVRKGAHPHLLVMTATPIPRTLGLTLYGDLDLSVIGQLPSGRAVVRTFVRAPEQATKVWEFVRTKLAEGRQAFVIYPRVEDTGQGLKAVTKEYHVLEKVFAGFKVGLLHGRMGVDQKDQVMEAFRANVVQVLLSTSLIEVGIDVPNATVMIIENAEQFGLAQLHQLRGRIGRGEHQSYCILMSDNKAEEAGKRLQVLAETSDGFRIAEADLKLRGAGNLLGPQQSGLPPFRFADLAEDAQLAEVARRIAGELVAASPKAEP